MALDLTSFQLQSGALTSLQVQSGALTSSRVQNGAFRPLALTTSLTLSQQVHRMWRHPSFDPDVLSHNVAIITLETAVKGYAPLPLDSDMQQAADGRESMFSVAGWGTLSAVVGGGRVTAEAQQAHTSNGRTCPVWKACHPNGGKLLAKFAQYGRRTFQMREAVCWFW